jgi:N-formylglutamate deformylase
MQPFELRAPSDPLPLIYDSPHSGRYYPEDFRYKPPLEVLRRGEDAYVDELIAGAAASGVTVLLANYPRCYVDANRDPDDLDRELLAEPWPGPLKPTGKTRRGLGLIRRYVTPGVEVHRERLTVAEVRHRLDNVYWPYHRALEDGIAALRERFGFAWHIDWHSMKSVGNAMTPDAGRRRADFVIGDLDGTSAEGALVALAAETLAGLGYRVALNDPYKGAAILRRHAAPARQVHSIQIEINRGLYLDEHRVAPGEGFAGLRRDLATLTARLAEGVRARLAREDEGRERLG